MYKQMPWFTGNYKAERKQLGVISYLQCAIFWSLPRKDQIDS